jgi:hypothetical protein
VKEPVNDLCAVKPCMSRSLSLNSFALALHVPTCVSLARWGKATGFLSLSE